MVEARPPFVGRKALVIGVETPAGAAIARALGAAGADVGLATMRADEGVLVAKRIQRELQAEGRKAATYAFDVTLGQNVKVSTRQVTKELGGLDLLVSASDRFFAAPLGRTTDSDLAQTMTVNCYAHLFAVRAAADEFRRAGGGRAVIVTHAAGEAGMPGASAYAAAHAATLNLVRSLSEELRPDRIAIDAIVTGALTADVDARADATEQVQADFVRVALELLSAPLEETGRIARLAAMEQHA
jgi:NAD(P)-dependent dehydrogenase (short-subunit alcohol dehydrogenase family)